MMNTHSYHSHLSLLHDWAKLLQQLLRSRSIKGCCTEQAGQAPTEARLTAAQHAATNNVCGPKQQKQQQQQVQDACKCSGRWI
jgi:hypothetical protein